MTANANLIVNTQVVQGNPFPNGAFWIIETQVYADGTSETYPWLAPAGADMVGTARSRADTINSNLLLKNTIPTPITANQARKAIVSAGIAGTITTIIANANSEVQALWYTADYFDRDNPDIIGIGNAAGLSNTELDQLFSLGATL